MALYKKIDSNMTFSCFLGEMVIKGLTFEEIWRDKEKTALEKFAKRDITGREKEKKQIQVNLPVTLSTPDLRT